MGNEAYLQQLLDFPKQIEEAAAMGRDVEISGPVENVVLAGMGGSAGPGEFLRSYVDFKIPFVISRDYAIPAFVNSRTLLFAISYSGNTEETVAALKAARRVNAKIVVVASGGKLEQIAKKENLPFIKIPAGMQPRAGLAYLFFPLLNVLARLNIIAEQQRHIRDTVEALNNPAYNERAKVLAAKLAGKTPLIYASPKLAAVAHKWKISFNENSKSHAFYNVFPELNHNEMVGFTKLNGSYHVVMLEDEQDERRIVERMRITKQLIAKRGVDVTLIAITGTSLLSRMFSAVHLGSLTSYYLAEEYGMDPEPVDVVEDFKKKLAAK